jgi:glycosyltransferase involved in cell wall biosynthesis
MRIAIDMQGAQTASRQRGIGRYTMSLVREIVMQRGEDEIILVLNSMFPESIDDIRNEFRLLLPNENITVWHAQGPVDFLSRDNDWRRGVAELTRESFVAELRPDFVLITSLFEGLGDNAVTSIMKLKSHVPTGVVFYDLIPYLYKNEYLPNADYRRWYESKLQAIKESDLLLAISGSSREEAIQHLGFAPGDVVNISAGVSDIFSRSANSTEKGIPTICMQLGIKKPFILFSGSVLEPRKNFRRMLNAFLMIDLKMRQSHQLVVVSPSHDGYAKRLAKLMDVNGMEKDTVVMTGYISDNDMVELYRCCKLFVFPSLHEGFGLPVLEAMASGAPVIGSCTSSVGEIIGLQQYTFHPDDTREMSNKIQWILSDDELLEKLREYGLSRSRAYSWGDCAQKTLSAIRRLNLDVAKESRVSLRGTHDVLKPKLAYVSPLPPIRSGISDYSVDLISGLEDYFDIDVITDQTPPVSESVANKVNIRNPEWLVANSDSYYCVLYHFGNSPYHLYMASLLNKVPGLVVLHDFYLSGVTAAMSHDDRMKSGLVGELYHSHGYGPLIDYLKSGCTTESFLRYPCSLRTLCNSRGVLVHSPYAIDLSKHWYPEFETSNFSVVPFVAGTPTSLSDETREELSGSIPPDAFVFASFGMLGPTKLNDRLLQCWLATEMATDNRCYLLFVGENHAGEYGHSLVELIRRNGLEKRIRITGWINRKRYLGYLNRASAAVQLRGVNRGETSAAVFDCLALGIPTIINNIGAMRSIPDDVVCKVSEEFSDQELIRALERLYHSESVRNELRRASVEFVEHNHSRMVVSNSYRDIIDRFMTRPEQGVFGLVDNICKIAEQASESEIRGVSRSIARNGLTKRGHRRLFVDVSRISHADLKTGIERVVRSLLILMLKEPPHGIRVEPVYADRQNTGAYKHARSFVGAIFGVDVSSVGLEDEPIDYRRGDIFLGLDLDQVTTFEMRHCLKDMHRAGVSIFFVVYDIIPLLYPNMFPHWMKDVHEKWLNTVLKFDGAICISKSVADELTGWASKNFFSRPESFRIGWFHQGMDIESSMPTTGLPDGADDVIKKIQETVSFLMVGTIEPRKGHNSMLTAFETLWSLGVDVQLVIVGKRGWMVDGVISRIEKHPELNKRLIWLEGISDEYLQRIYSASDCLIAASEAEGFGLPIVEAARYGKPIIARDIPVFREVAGDSCMYFSDSSAEQLPDTIMNWLDMYRLGHHPRPEGVRRLTWKESVDQLLGVIWDWCGLSKNNSDEPTQL